MVLAFYYKQTYLSLRCLFIRNKTYHASVKSFSVIFMLRYTLKQFLAMIGATVACNLCCLQSIASLSLACFVFMREALWRKETSFSLEDGQIFICMHSEKASREKSENFRFFSFPKAKFPCQLNFLLKKYKNIILKQNFLPNGNADLLELLGPSNGLLYTLLLLPPPLPICLCFCNEIESSD